MAIVHFPILLHFRLHDFNLLRCNYDIQDYFLRRRATVLAPAGRAYRDGAKSAKRRRGTMGHFINIADVQQLAGQFGVCPTRRMAGPVYMYSCAVLSLPRIATILGKSKNCIAMPWNQNECLDKRCGWLRRGFRQLVLLHCATGSVCVFNPWVCLLSHRNRKFLASGTSLSL